MNVRGIGVVPLVGVEVHLQACAVIARPPVNGETCDVCSQLLAAVDIFFDGERFLCPACRHRLSLTLRK